MCEHQLEIHDAKWYWLASCAWNPLLTRLFPSTQVRPCVSSLIVVCWPCWMKCGGCQGGGEEQNDDYWTRGAEKQCGTMTCNLQVLDLFIYLFNQNCNQGECIIRGTSLYDAHLSGLIRGICKALNSNPLRNRIDWLLFLSDLRVVISERSLPHQASAVE